MEEVKWGGKDDDPSTNSYSLDNYIVNLTPISIVIDKTKVISVKLHLDLKFLLYWVLKGL